MEDDPGTPTIGVPLGCETTRASGARAANGPTVPLLPGAPLGRAPLVARDGPAASDVGEDAEVSA